MMSEAIRNAVALRWALFASAALCFVAGSAAIAGLAAPALYRETLWVVPQVRGQDALTLFAIAVLMVCLVLTARGSTRAILASIRIDHVVCDARADAELPGQFVLRQERIAMGISGDPIDDKNAQLTLWPVERGEPRAQPGKGGWMLGQAGRLYDRNGVTGELGLCAAGQCDSAHDQRAQKSLYAHHEYRRVRPIDFYGPSRWPLRLVFDHATFHLSCGAKRVATHN